MTKREFSMDMCIDHFSEEEDEAYLFAFDMGVACENCGDPFEGHCRCSQLGWDMLKWDMTRDEVLDLYRSQAGESWAEATARARKRRARRLWRVFQTAARAVGKQASVVKYIRALYLESLAPGGKRMKRAQAEFEQLRE